MFSSGEKQPKGKPVKAYDRLASSYRLEYSMHEERLGLLRIFPAIGRMTLNQMGDWHREPCVSTTSGELTALKSSHGYKGRVNYTHAVVRWRDGDNATLLAFTDTDLAHHQGYESLPFDIALPSDVAYEGLENIVGHARFCLNEKFGVSLARISSSLVEPEVLQL